MNYQHILKNKIISKKSVICVVGLGYVGSELLKKFNYEGFKTIGIDINLNRVKKLFNKKKIFLTDNYKHVNSADIIILALPTPLKKVPTFILKIHIPFHKILLHCFLSILVSVLQ